MPVDPSIGILVVDDFTTMCRIIESLLKRLGFANTSYVRDGQAALDLLLSQSFALVLADGYYAGSLAAPAKQLDRLEFADLRMALAKLPYDQRETVILVAAAGFSYDEAAAICGCALGTIKSRLNRARIRLAELLLDRVPQS
jgi:DNA-directed RNA polymerase specialized sigma24 family protein